MYIIYERAEGTQYVRHSETAKKSWPTSIEYSLCKFGQDFLDIMHRYCSLLAGFIFHDPPYLILGLKPFLADLTCKPSIIWPNHNSRQECATLGIDRIYNGPDIWCLVVYCVFRKSFIRILDILQNIWSDTGYLAKYLLRYRISSRISGRQRLITSPVFLQDINPAVGGNCWANFKLTVYVFSL